MPRIARVNHITINVVSLMEQFVAGQEQAPDAAAIIDLALAQVEAIDPRTAQRFPRNPTGYKAPLRDALAELLEADRGLKARLEALLARSKAGDRYQAAVDSGAAAQGPEAKAVGEKGVLVDGAVGGSVVIAETGARVFIGEQPVKMTAVDRESALGRYLQHLISRNRYLQLQGIRSGGKLVHIELDQIYVTLRTTRQRVVSTEEAWLAEETTLAPASAGQAALPGPALRSRPGRREQRPGQGEAGPGRERLAAHPAAAAPDRRLSA